MKKITHTDKAPKAIGPYSQANAIDQLIFTSGQLPLNPETMKMPEDIKSQARQSLENLKNILEAAGGSLQTVVKTTCFLADMTHFAAFNEVYAEFFGTQGAPARSCFQVARLPMDALVEIEAIAYKA
ncbi:MAG: RidA family protein [Saezia sp.]